MATDRPTTEKAMTHSTFDTPGSNGADTDPGYVPGVQYDRYKRYLIPRPGGDPEDLQSWTRVTTLTGMLTSNEGLRVWTERNIVRGIGMRADLRALLASDPDNKATQDEVLATAKEVAGVGSSASWGRALHRAVERHTDPGATGAVPPAPDLSEQFGRDAQAALECLASNNVKVRMVEQVIVHEALGYAGRTDALWEVTLPDGRVVLRVGDVKTGDKLDMPAKRQVMGAQLAAYVNATHMYDPAGRSFSPLPDELDRTVGYVLSVRDGVAQLYELDLTTGWTDVLIAVKLHRRRSASTDMFPVGRPVRVEESLTGNAPTPRPSALVEEASTPAPVGQQPGPSMAAQAGADRVAALVEEANTPVLVAQAPAVPEPELGPTGRKRRACSVCRKPGHTAKNCPDKDGPQAPAQPVDSGVPASEPPSSMEELAALNRSCTCTTPPGWSVPSWSSRPDVMVCGGCGLPSAAVLAKVRGERTGMTALAQVAAADGAPPWQTPPESTLSLMDRINRVGTKGELQDLWQKSMSEWTDEHTQRARELLPTLQ